MYLEQNLKNPHFHTFVKLLVGRIGLMLKFSSDHIVNSPDLYGWYRIYSIKHHPRLSATPGLSTTCEGQNIKDRCPQISTAFVHNAAHKAAYHSFEGINESNF